MLRITEDQVRRLLSMQDAIERLRLAFRDYGDGNAQNQPRRRLVLKTGATLHSLAGAWGNYFGTKVYSTHIRHGAWFTVLLFDAETARPLAELEANYLGQIRTGATSGLAADVLLPARAAITVGCIGAGFQARSQIEALAAVRPVKEVNVYSRNQQTREQFAKELSQNTKLPVRAVRSAREAARDCTVLVTATWAKDPVIEAEDVPEGALVLAVGSNQPQRRELPGELVRNSFIVVDDRSACQIEAGDLLMALKDDDWDLTAELKRVMTHPREALASRGARTTIFKSVGLGLEDVAAASLVYERLNGVHS